MGIPLCVICCFPLLLLIFVLSVWSLLIWLICVGVFILGFILFGTLWVSWNWVTSSFPILGKFSTIISSSIFSQSFFLSSSSGTPMIQMLVCLTLSQRSLRLSSFLLFIFFFFFPLCFIYFHHSIFYLTDPIFCLPYSTVGSLQSGFFFFFNLMYCIIHSVQFSLSVISDSLRPHELLHTRPTSPSPTPRVHSNPCSLCRWCH